MEKLMGKKENVDCLPHCVHYLVPLLVSLVKKKNNHQLFMAITGQHAFTALFSTPILTLENDGSVSVGNVAGCTLLGMKCKMLDTIRLIAAGLSIVTILLERHELCEFLH